MMTNDQHRQLLDIFQHSMLDADEMTTLLHLIEDIEKTAKQALINDMRDAIALHNHTHPNQGI